MEKPNNYFKERDFQNLQRLKKILSKLPYFCDEYFRGIENQTTMLSRLGYARDLQLFFNFLTSEIIDFESKGVKDLTIEDLSLISATHIEIYLNYLSGYYSNGKYYTNDARAKARKLCAIRSMMKYFFKKDKISSNVSQKIDTPKIRDKEIIRLEVDEVVNLLNTAEEPKNMSKRQISYASHTKKRDVAILTLLLGTGIRVSECVGLNIDDIDFNSNAFVITRKGGAKTILYFSDEVASAINDYLEERFSNENIPQSERALFLSIQNKRMGVRSVEKLVQKYSEASIPLKHITPHKLRSTFGTNLYRETGDIYLVADVLGHKDVNTTKKHYAAISEDARKNVAKIIKLRDKV